MSIVVMACNTNTPIQLESELSFEETPSMFQVQTVIQNNCTECHSKTPTHIGLSQPPAGVTFDNETEILSQIEGINERAILRKEYEVDPMFRTEIGQS